MAINDKLTDYTNRKFDSHTDLRFKSQSIGLIQEQGYISSNKNYHKEIDLDGVSLFLGIALITVVMGYTASTIYNSYIKNETHPLIKKGF